MTIIGIIINTSSSLFPIIYGYESVMVAYLIISLSLSLSIHKNNRLLMSARCLSVIVVVVSPPRISEPLQFPASFIHGFEPIIWPVEGISKYPRDKDHGRRGKIISMWNHVSTLLSRDSARIKDAETERNRDSRHNKKPSENNTDWSKHTVYHLSFSTSFTTLSRFTIQDLSVQVLPISKGGRETDGKKLELLRSLSHLETRKKRDGKMGFDEAIYPLGRKRRENKLPSLSFHLCMISIYVDSWTQCMRMCCRVLHFYIVRSHCHFQRISLRGRQFHPLPSSRKGLREI